MKKIITLLILIISLNAVAQDAQEIYNTGKRFLQQADYENAILVLKKASNMKPYNMLYKKDLTNAYYYKGDYANAKKNIDQLVDFKDADEEVFYLACIINKSAENNKEAEKYIKKGLAKFTKSGLLYNEYGTLLALKNDPTSIVQFENGIEQDPNFPGNYYNAAHYYYYTNFILAKIWSIYYGEIFINMESYTPRTVEIKKIIFDSYKQLLTNESFVLKNTKNDFEIMFRENLLKYKNIISTGITTQNLIKIRTLFILNWYSNQTAFESSLFSRQQQLLREGFFEDYNYWIFETIQDAATFENWMELHKASFNNFSKYFKSVLFKMSKNEYYKLTNKN